MASLLTVDHYIVPSPNLFFYYRSYTSPHQGPDSLIKTQSQSVFIQSVNTNTGKLKDLVSLGIDALLT